MKNYRILFWTFAPIALVAMILTLGAAAMPAAANPLLPNGGAIDGNVTSPNGYPLPTGTVVKLFDPFDGSVLGKASPDLNDGSFSIGPVPNGLYIVKAVPPAGSNLTQSQPVPTSVINNPVNIGSLALTTPQISGTVTAPDGVTPADADVAVFAGSKQIVQYVDAPGGDFAIGGLPAGSYALVARPDSDDPYWNSPKVNISVTNTSKITLTLTLTNAQLWGYTEDDQGNPVKFATAVAANRGGSWQTDKSNANGFWSIGGLPAGGYWLTALPPLQNNGLMSPRPISVTLPGASNPYTLTFDIPPKVVTGVAGTNTGLPVQDAKVIARRVNLPGSVTTQTAADGTYQLNLSSGLWALTIKPISTTVPSGWVYPQPPQLVYFKFNNSPQNTQQDFTVLIADATASGVVEMPDSSTPPFTVTVGLYDGQGIGKATQIDPADGSFSVDLPNGNYDVVVSPQDNGYLGPAVNQVTLPISGSIDLGTLTLLPRDALITGTVTADGGATSVDGTPLVAWRPGIPGSLRTASGPGGVYALAVTTGTWYIQPAPGPGDPYIYTGQGQQLTLQSGEVVTDVNFDLVTAEATITGILVDKNGDPVTSAQGWATAVDAGNPIIHNGAPINGGGFAIYVPGGTYDVAAHLPASNSYMSAGQRQVSVASGGAVTITLTVADKDATIAGALWDPRNQVVVSGVSGAVGVWGSGNGTATSINTGNGSYSMDVAAGVWQLNYRIDPTNYAKTSGPQSIPVQSGQTVGVPLRVVPKDGAIEGDVLDPSGNPLPGAAVLVRGLAGEVAGLWLYTQAQLDGTFHVDVPYGQYGVGATIGPGSSWIKPVNRTVQVLPGSTSGGHTLQFQEPDAVISGTLTVTSTVDDGTAYLWAWSDDGGFTQGYFPVTQAGGGGWATGVYSLDVVSGTVWHVGAVFETGSEYWLGKVDVDVNSSTMAQDITLSGPSTKPGPVVITFDAANPQSITLADGTQIFIPGGAMPVSGTVTLRIVPIAALPQQSQANVVTYGYAFFATDASGMSIESSFNQDVVIRFSYDESALKGYPENLLKPAYFSTTTNQWTIPDSYAIDTAANEVVAQIDHFTDFALITEGGSVVYLPIVVR